MKAKHWSWNYFIFSKDVICLIIINFYYAVYNKIYYKNHDRVE